jgi:hypothetical protein
MQIVTKEKDESHLLLHVGRPENRNTLVHAYCKYRILYTEYIYDSTNRDKIYVHDNYNYINHYIFDCMVQNISNKMSYYKILFWLYTTKKFEKNEGICQRINVTHKNISNV